MIDRKVLEAAADQTGELGYGRTPNGQYSPFLKSIFIANDLTGWQYRDTLHWERCRAYLHETTGSPLFSHEKAK